MWMLRDARTAWLLMYDGSNLSVVLKSPIITIWCCRGMWFNNCCRLLQILALLGRNWSRPLETFHECWYIVIKSYVHSRNRRTCKILPSEWDAVAIWSSRARVPLMRTNMDACFEDECTQCHPWHVQVALKFHPISCNIMMSNDWTLHQCRNSSYIINLDAFHIIHRRPRTVQGVGVVSNF